MLCKIINKIFSFSLIDEEKLDPIFENYVIRDVVPSYQINVNLINKIEILDQNLLYKTDYFDLYKDENKLIQYQKNNDEYFGKIIYQDNLANIYITKDDIFSKQYLLTQYVFSHFVTRDLNAIFMHGSSINYKGIGLLFSAKSGVGKSTHAKLWTDFFEATPVNDDKNVIVLENDKLYIYGNPFSGKHFRNSNQKVELKYVIYLYQNKTNIIKKIDEYQSFILMMNQIKRPTEDINDKEKWNIITNKILSLPTYMLGCNTEKDAVETVLKILED